MVTLIIPNLWEVLIAREPSILQQNSKRFILQDISEYIIHFYLTDL